MPLVQPVSKKDHVQGGHNASVELLEYGDYQCPYCGQAYPIVKELQRQLGSKLSFVFRNFPLRKVHPYAMHAAMASEAASLQGRFWEMHDILFENQPDLDQQSVIQYAKSIGLVITQFESDLKSPDIEKKVLSDFQGGLMSGVNATPTFFVNGDKYEGDWTAHNFLLYLKSSAR
jgi:protein-disulfide isomerase